eukprot:gene44945-59484_t
MSSTTTVAVGDCVDPSRRGRDDADGAGAAPYTVRDAALAAAYA